VCCRAVINHIKKFVVGRVEGENGIIYGLIDLPIKKFPQGALAIGVDQQDGFQQVVSKIQHDPFIQARRVQRAQDKFPVGCGDRHCFDAVEKPLKDAGIKTVQYVSPSVWAWREKRIHTISAATNLVLALLPFEKEFYDKHQVPCTFVGHTLADDIALEHDDSQARQELGLNTDDKVLALLPGSRGSEVGLLSETYIKTAAQLQAQNPNLNIVVPLVNEKRKAQFTDILNATAPSLNISLLDGQSKLAMQAADAILLASGTATLEGMLYKKPMVVGYKIKPLSYWIFKTLFTFNIKYFSLPNLLADEELVPEFLQSDCNVKNLTQALTPMLETDNRQLKARFLAIHENIRLNASEQAANAVAELIHAN